MENFFYLNIGEPSSKAKYNYLRSSAQYREGKFLKKVIL